nr:MAG: major capsid protein [Microviridae sp.]
MATNIFTKVRIPKVGRNKFDLTHQVKLTTEFGRLTPCACIEVVPGDTFKISTDLLCRMMPLATPVMHNFEIYTHFFFVPQRLVWSEWQNFITGGKDGTLAPQIPHLVIPTKDAKTAQPLFAASSLANYIGYPVIDSNKVGADVILDARPFRAYQLIYNEYYRDENQTNEIQIHADWSGDKQFERLATGDYVTDMLSLRQRCWRKDYFTSALPWPEQGAQGMRIPVKLDSEIIPPEGSDPEVKLAFLQDGVSQAVGGTKLYYYNETDSNWQLVDGADTLTLKTNDDGSIYAVDNNSGIQYMKLAFDVMGNSVVSTTTLDEYIRQCRVNSTLADNSTTVNDFRRAVAAQKWLEAAARGGHRYIESMLSHFGVKSSDARLQRPEYLGGGKTTINIGDVLQTSQTTQDSPQGQYAGIGAAAANIKQFKSYFEEHGYIIGIVSVMPRADYFQGIPRMFLRSDKFDYFWPEFSHIGEQPIYNSELYYNPSLGVDRNTFGYTPRYAEYKYIPNRVTGGFSDIRDELLTRWHDARMFDKAPSLNQEFLEVKTHSDSGDLNRIFTYGAPDTDHIMLEMQHNVLALRKMPKFGTPLI